mgnify:CR=1 FL=1
MDRLRGEEKKDATEEAIGEEGSDTGSEDDQDDCEELGDLPPEIAYLSDQVFQSEEALQEALDNAGFGDLRVVLVEGKARLVKHSDQHNAFTSDFVFDFISTWRKWVYCTLTHKIHLLNGRSGDPDISFWGYPRCSKSPRTPYALRPTNRSIPDVVINFSWKNTRSYEEEAIDDMMNRGLEQHDGPLSTDRPRLGYLIKVRFSKKRPRGSRRQAMNGLDIYRLTHGTTIADACDPNNSSADHWRYLDGGPDLFITIKPQDLGITGVWAVVCGEYKIKASDLFNEMKDYHTKRQAT